MWEEDDNTEALDNVSFFAVEQCLEELKLACNHEAIPYANAFNPTKIVHFDVNWIGKKSYKEFAIKFTRGKLEWEITFKKCM